MEQIEKQFITSYQSNLAKEGKEICEEVVVMIGDKDELILEKARACCEFFCSYKLDGVNTEKLVEKCENYLENLNTFHKYKSTFKQANFVRKEKEKRLEVRNFLLK